MLFLVLGTTTAFADKYYKARYSYSSKHRVSELKTDGTKYMIYNTTFNNNTAQKKVEDLTGFLYSNNTIMGLSKTRDSGILIYNDCFVFTLEDAGDDDANTFYIKSEKGVYIDAEGNPSISPVKLLLYTWDDATQSNAEYSINGGNVVLNDDNDIKQAFVRSEHPDYTVIPENQITSNDNKVFVICNESKDTYWSSEVNNEDKTVFSSSDTGQPFAFYDTEEVTSVGSFEIRDLHIFSRCDLYSAQQIYGYIKKASQIKPVLSNGTEINFGDGLATAAPLLDGDNNTFAATDWTNHNKVHAFEIDLEAEDVTSFRLYMQRRADSRDILTTFELQVSTDGTNFISKGTYETTLGSTASYNKLFTSGELGGSAIKKIRIVATATSAMPDYECMGLAELYVLPDNDVINNGIEFFDSSLPIYATEADYKAKIEEYNSKVSAVKLLSGVPIPGNKYRIYADAYNDDTADDVDNPAYVNRDVSIAVADDVYSLVANTNYHTAGDNATAFEWYCEETSSGKIVLRNVKYPGKYLANGTVSDTPYEWQFNTNHTQRHGVPLVDNSSHYLTLLNDATGWVADIGWVQNQKTTLNCTDFVFLPVEITGTEKKITIIASELATRNAKLTLGDDAETVYRIPFSRIFNGASDLPDVVSTADTYHDFIGFFKKGTETKLCEKITTEIYNNSIVSGDTLEARFEVNQLFEKSTDSEIKLYRIKNAKNKQIASQQAKPNRASVNIETNEGDQVSASGGVGVYAKFAEGDKNIDLVYTDKDKADARTLFYFTNSEPYDNESANVFINSAVTTKKFKKAAEWTDAGQLYFVQPNLVSGGYKGFTISGTKLNASNAPGNAWVGDFSTNVINLGNAENEGAAWEFEKVDDDIAEPLLKDYIKSLASGIMDDLLAKKDSTEFYDTDRVQSAIDFIEDNVGIYTPGANPGQGTFTGDALDNITISALVKKSQTFHMLKHELKYAMQKFPELTTEPAGELDKTKPKEYQAKWYYVKNVYGTDSKDEPLYAKYNGANNLMKLSTDEPTLANLFYFSGEELRLPKDSYHDDYLKVHVHNFMAQNLKEKSVSNDSTLVSDNNTIFTVENFEGSGTENQDIAIKKPLSNDIAWEITAEFDNATGTFSNGWGTALLATGDKSNGTYYGTGFQVFLKQDGRLVIKAGDSGNNDVYVFTHTQNAYSYLKVVLSYADKRLKVYVTNSQGLTQTIINADIHNRGRDYIPCPDMANIEKLCAYMPKGVFIESLTADAVSAMKWNKHSNNAVGFADWYIHPSSNTEYVGLDVTVKEPNDQRLGWANSDGEHDDIFMDMGTSNYATWQFERVTDFTGHILELLDMYNVANCVIYNDPLVELYNKLVALAAGEKVEDTFNAMTELIREYGSPDPSEYLAPKPGKLYTIHHVPAWMPNDFKVDNNNVVKINEDVNVADEIDSRGVWVFDGTENNGSYLIDENLVLKSLHTQSSPYAAGFTDASLKLSDETSNAISIEKCGGAVVRLKVNDKYLSTGAGDGIVSNADAASSNYIGTTFSHSGTIQSVTSSSVLYNNVPLNTAFEFTGADAIKVVKENVTSSIICPDKNANTDPEFEFILTYRGLPAGATYNNVALDIHALNDDCKYQSHGDKVVREWNIAVKNGSDVELGELTNIDIAKDVNPDGDRHKVWDVALTTPATADVDGNLTVKIIVSKGTTNAGCFFGLSSVALSTADARHDQWFIEEIENPEDKVYYIVPSLLSSSVANPDSRAYASLYLGFNATTPAGIDAWVVNSINTINQLEMENVNGIVPAEEGVILTSASPMSNQKFYYSATPSTVDASGNILLGTAYTKLVECGSTYNIYMLGKKNDRIAMYWAYENRNENGVKETIGGTTEHNESGWVQCNANKSYLFEKENQSAPALYAFFFDGDATGIDDITAADAASENTSGVCDLQGRKLERVTEPGIYIVNGKKVFVREIE